MSILAPLADARPAVAAPQPSSNEQLARDIYRELVEIDTVTATGDTAKAAHAMAARLRAAGFGEADVHVFVPAPMKGNLVARLRGTGARRPILLLAHLDVVAAKREDWSTEPFTLVEKDGWFYGRGTSDDKAMAAAWISNLIRYRREGHVPERDIVVVLSTDEEIADSKGVGITWLLEHHRALIDAELALNEGGEIAFRNGAPTSVNVQTSEKAPANFDLEVKSPGGHSSVPARDNPIYRLARGLTRLASFRFPTPPDRHDAALAREGCGDRGAFLRHAINALPQSAKARVICRLLRGERVEDVGAALVRVLADEQIEVTNSWRPAVANVASPVAPALMSAIERLGAESWPGIPVVPTMATGSTDGSFLRGAGIPTYGHCGFRFDLDDIREHGKDERLSVASFHQGTEYLYRLVKVLAGAEDAGAAQRATSR